MVNKVKRSESGMIVDPITLQPRRDAARRRNHHARVPNKRRANCGAGRQARRYFNQPRPALRGRLHAPRRRPDDAHSALSPCRSARRWKKARDILKRHKVEKLLVVDEAYTLQGLITIKDIQKKLEFPNAAKDSLGRLRVAAAVGVANDLEARAAALVKAGVDALVLDSAHGHSQGVLDALRYLKESFSVDVVAGNIATRRGGRGPRKPRRGPRSRWASGRALFARRGVVTGVGMPQLTAIMGVAEVAGAAGVPLIADGGVKMTGDVPKAIAAGADCVMVGSMLAGDDRSAGREHLARRAALQSVPGHGQSGCDGRVTDKRAALNATFKKTLKNSCPKASRAWSLTRGRSATCFTR